MILNRKLGLYHFLCYYFSWVRSPLILRILLKLHLSLILRLPKSVSEWSSEIMVLFTTYLTRPYLFRIGTRYLMQLTSQMASISGFVSIKTTHIQLLNNWTIQNSKLVNLPSKKVLIWSQIKLPNIGLRKIKTIQ